jgi:hypothetical protein
MIIMTCLAFSSLVFQVSRKDCTRWRYVFNSKSTIPQKVFGKEYSLIDKNIV